MRVSLAARKFGKILSLLPFSLAMLACGRFYSPLCNQSDLPAMSQHNSFKTPGGIQKKRNVLKRFERVELLQKRGQWKDGNRVTGLRKTKPEE